jgi:hypothetical protein
MGRMGMYLHPLVTTMIEHGELSCACGARVPFDDQDDRVRCDCGADYLITVTKIRSGPDS